MLFRSEAAGERLQEILSGYRGVQDVDDSHRPGKREFRLALKEEGRALGLSVESLARQVAAAPTKTLMAVGMGPNQFFNNDNKDRDIFLLAALTGNVGKITGNVGSYAGNYRVALFNGLPQYINENPFDVEKDPAKPARPRQYWKPESAHYYKIGRAHV